MAEAKSKKYKVIAKNSKLTKEKAGKSIIRVRYNHVLYEIVESEPVELPEGLAIHLKEHITDKIKPSGKISVKGKNYQRIRYNSFEVIEV